MAVKPEDAEENSNLIDEAVDQNPFTGRIVGKSSNVRRLMTCRRVLIAFAVVFVGLFLIGAFNNNVRQRIKSSFDYGEDNDEDIVDEDGKNPLLDEDTSESITPEAEEEISEEEEGEDLVQGLEVHVNNNKNEPASQPKSEGEGEDSEEEGGDDEGEGIDPEKEAAKNEVLTLGYFADQCKQYKEKFDTLDPVMKQIAAADCGWGYDYINTPARTKPWKVALFGPTLRNEILDLSGCPAFCPNSPKCKIDRSSIKAASLHDADVIVIFQSDANDYISRLPEKKSNGQPNYKVVYWREAVMSSPTYQTQKRFDFEMGVHYYSGLNNPIFLRKPGQYLSGAVFPYPPIDFVPVEQRTKFAISIISHCGAGSHRDEYIDKLEAILGHRRVDRFGSCSGKRLPGRSINVAFKLMASYKFYFSFENTIEDGYVTEKLFFVMNVPVLPIYYGAMNVPNITNTPSFIKVSDFSTPKQLADYLLYLDSHPEEYMKYHSWRTDPSSFSKEYLERLQNRVAGPDELLFFKKKGFKRFPRTAQCCRLCDEKFVKMAAASRGPESLVEGRMSSREIEKRFFGGPGHMKDG